MALALQASLLVRHGDPAVADAFCASRLGGDHGMAFGTLPRGTDFERHHRAGSAADELRGQSPRACRPESCGRSPAKRSRPRGERRTGDAGGGSGRRTSASPRLRPVARVVYNVGRFTDMALDSFHPRGPSFGPLPETSS